MKFTRFFIYLFWVATALLVACNQPSAREILKEAEAMGDRGQMDSAACLLEEKIIPSCLPDSSKATYWYLLSIFHSNQGRSLINDSLINFTLRYDKEHDKLRLFTTYELVAAYNHSVGNKEKNEALFREAIAEAETRKDTNANANFHHKLANFYYNKREYQQVINVARELATISDIGKASAWYILGLNYGRMGIEDSATWYMARAAELAYEIKSGIAFHFARNYADHLSSSNPRKALEYLEYLKTIFPDKTLNRTYAGTWVHLGQKDSADYYLTKAIDESNKNTDSWYMTGRVNLMALRMVWQVQHRQPYSLSTIGQYCDSVSLASYRVIQNEKERAFAQKKLIQDNARIEADRQQAMLFLFVFLFLFVLIGSIVFFYIRNRRDKLLETEEKLESLQQLLREAATAEPVSDSSSPDSKFFRKVLLQQLGIIRLMATTPTEQNQELLQQMSRIANEHVPADALLVWEDLFPLIDAVYDGFYTRLTQFAAGRLSEKEIQLCCLLCAGFSTKEISVVTRQSVRTIYQRKSTIRHALCMDEKDDIVDYINRKS